MDCSAWQRNAPSPPPLQTLIPAEGHILWVARQSTQTQRWGLRFRTAGAGKVSTPVWKQNPGLRSTIFLTPLPTGLCHLVEAGSRWQCQEERSRSPSHLGSRLRPKLVTANITPSFCAGMFLPFSGRAFTRQVVIAAGQPFSVLAPAGWGK